MKDFLMVGLAAAVAAVAIETALVPGVLIGGVAVLAPRLLLPNRRRRTRPDPGRSRPPAARRPEKAEAAAPKLAIKQAIAKTFTYQAAFTTVDFAAHYLVLADLAAAAGLSAAHFAVGPALYLPHEALWNYLSPPATDPGAPDAPALLRGASGPSAGRQGFAISRVVAKTITFRTVASAAEFTAHYIVVGNFATAAALSALGFVVGPFVYFGHEVAWDHFGAPGARPASPASLLPTRAGTPAAPAFPRRPGLEPPWPAFPVDEAGSAAPDNSSR